jgi:hypothetical protein
MGEVIPLFALAAALVAILANIALWSPRRLRVKVVALCSLALLLPTLYLSLAELLGQPKPVETEWAKRELAEATVLAAKMEEGEAISLWLALEDLEQPRAYVLPWDQEMAKQLFEAEREAEANGTNVRMRLPFESIEEEIEQKFYAEPQPALPPKKTSDEVSRLEQ